MEYGDTMPPGRLVLANSTRKATYSRAITEEERNGYNQQIADNTIEILQKEEAKKDAARMYNDEIKSIKLERATAIGAVRTGSVDVTDTVHTFFDYDAGKVHEYNANGERILTRRIKPSETQTTIPTNE